MKNPSFTSRDTRGRPKISVTTYIYYQNSIALNNHIFTCFFKTKERKIDENNPGINLVQYKDLLYRIFDKLYLEKEGDFKVKYEKDIMKNNLFKLILEDIDLNLLNNNRDINNKISEETNNFNNNTNINEVSQKNKKNLDLLFSIEKRKRNNQKEKKTNDIVLKEYLDFCRFNTNAFFFHKILYFMFLYRELISFYKKESFLQNNRPGKLLYFVNSFFEYLEEVGLLQQFTDEDKIGIVENLIHFACWLSKKCYTYNKIFLGFLDSK